MLLLITSFVNIRNIMGNNGKEGAPKENEPKSTSIYVVVADNSADWRNEILSALNDVQEFNIQSIPVTTFPELINSAGMAKDFDIFRCLQADMVILGDDFKEDTSSWEPSHFYQEEDSITTKLSKLGVEDKDIYTILPPSSKNLATLLRLFGYNGSIVLVKDHPRDELLAEINNYKERFEIERLVDAVAHKKSFYGEDFHYWLLDEDGIFQLHTECEQPNLGYVLGKILMHADSLNPQE